MSRRLTGWAEIQKFTGFTSKTIRRWAREADFPLCEAGSGPKRVIFAFTGAVEEWFGRYKKFRGV